jgi:hypothetical protein
MMQAIWPVLTFYLSVLAAFGVGVVALVTGNSPSMAVLKAGTALLVFSILGWVLNMILFTAQLPSPDTLDTRQPDEELDADENVVIIDRTSESGQSDTGQDELSPD